MPELPEVETTCRALAPILEGSRFTEVVLMRPDLRFKFPVGFCDVLQNKTITSVKRRAKYILVTLEDGTVLISHLGMSGSFRLRSEESSKLFKHEHVVFFTSSGHELRYCDPRRFGFMLIAKIEN